MEEVFRRKPYLQFLRGKTSPELRTTLSRDGRPIPEENGRPLCSTYGPAKEAERILSGADGLKRTQILVILGAGNPELFQAHRKLLPGQICLVLDHRLDLGGYYLDLYIEENASREARAREGKSAPLPSGASAEPSEPSGIYTYLNTPGCHLFFGEETFISLEHYLEGLPAENFQGIRFLKHRASVDKAPEFYEYAESRMRGILQSRMSDLLTRFEFEPLWLRNTLLNSEKARAHPCPENLLTWQNRWPGKPALLVSAGPSLTESLPWIKTHQDKFFLLACDTALKPLLRAGIRPHGAHILDAQKQTLLHFLNEDLSDLVIFADLVCHPSLPLHLNPAGWVFSSTARLIYRPDGSTEELKTPGTDLLESMCGAQGRLQSGGSVATSAFDLLRFLGFRSIYFAGQDLAWTHRQLHAVNTHHYERWNGMIHRTLSLETINERVMQKRDLTPVPSVNGSTLSGDFILSLYRNWFEQSIESLKEEDPVQCFNLSRNGALIQGMENIRMKDPDLVPPGDGTFAHQARRELLEAFSLEDSRAPELAAELKRILDSLERLHNSPNKDAAENVWNAFPDLKALIRRTEVYISRNREKLSEERGADVYSRNLAKNLREFLRFSRRYVPPQESIETMQ